MKVIKDDTYFIIIWKGDLISISPGDYTYKDNIDVQWEVKLKSIIFTIDNHYFSG